MNGWLIFWTIALIVSGCAFAFITAAVTVLGFRDLRHMFAGLSHQREDREP
jgi:hypothetical protein